MLPMRDVPHYSPSLLSAFLDCEHLLRLELSAQRGEIERPLVRSAESELSAAKGAEHEETYLRALTESGLSIATIDRAQPFDAAVAETESAMRRGVDVVYQATFMDGPWSGRADFLRRIERPSVFGPWSYEVEDTKLATKPKPHFLLQLCFYTEHVARMQGSDPVLMHVVLGTSERVSLRYADFSAYFRRIRSQFMSEAARQDAQTYPYPVARCGSCDWCSSCESRWLQDDHLTLIPFIRRDHVAALMTAGITTVEMLAEREAPAPDGVGESSYDAYRHHARLQRQYREDGVHLFELLAPVSDRGFAHLPEPSEGDVFLDLEGDPFFEVGRGLEYLLGVVTRDRETMTYRAFWAHDRQEEKNAFESLIGFISERRRSWPDLHVYHYAPYEPTALTRLMGRHGTCEDTLDDLLRNRVFVDLYAVVRQALRTSLPGYSIKHIRNFFMPDAGHTTVVDAGGSIVAYERWCESQDPAELEAIRLYNEEDCISNVALRGWLLERREEAAAAFGAPIPWFTPPAPKGPAPQTTERRARQEALESALKARAGQAGDETTGAFELIASLIQYHRREAVPQWHAYFERLEATDDDLLDNAEAIAGLRPTGESEPVKRSIAYTLTFPPQEHKLSDGQVDDPATKAPAGSLLAVDDLNGTLKLKRGQKLGAAPLPTSVVAGGPVQTREQEEALIRVGQVLLDQGLVSPGRFRALAQLLLRKPPVIAGVGLGENIQTTDLEVTKAYVRQLDHSCLFIQGPPGTGKTWRGARLIVDLISAGRTVGVTAQSHKAIHKLLGEISRAARDAHVMLRGLKKATSGSDDSYFPDDEFISNVESNGELSPIPAGVMLVAGTSWLFSDPGMQESLDYLFIDEAGQFGLADTCAVGTAAQNIVLLGDPSQLAQVSTGSHPAGAERSALEHLLGTDATIPSNRGLFLEESWRMHDNVCRFVSQLTYEGRLRSRPECSLQAVKCPGWPDAGIRFVPVRHSGNSQRSFEEATVIAAQISTLLSSATFVEADGKERRLDPNDILVMAAYNQQVRCLRDHLPQEVRVGTVDKFQGQEAPVVFYSMACSSADAVPRGLEFLFSRNRLNVAISRARCIATVVASPRLLDAACRTADQMRLVNSLCRLAEYSREMFPTIEEGRNDQR